MNLIYLNARRALLVFFVLFSVMVLVLGTLAWETTRITNTYADIKKEYALERMKKFQAIEDADYLTQNIDGFNSYNEQGVIGTVDPIVWLEAFESIRQEMELTELFYDIGQPETLPGSYGGNVAVQVITIDLQIGFRHDEALFLFFDTLKSSLNVSYQITQLDIERVPNNKNQQEAVLKSPVHLVATSQISWVSIVPITRTDESDVQGA